MKKVLLVLALVLAVSLVSCSPEDVCGIVTGFDIKNNGTYRLFIDGTPKPVNFSTWLHSDIGEYVCIEY